MFALAGIPRDAAAKYNAKVPAVVVPVLLAVKLNASSSKPVKPVTLKAPIVESVDTFVPDT